MPNRNTARIQSVPMKLWLRLSLLCLICIVVTACGGNNNDEDKMAKDEDKVVATYDGGQITQKEFDSYLGVNLFLNPLLTQYMNMIPNFEAEMLNQFIGLKLLASEADETMQQEAQNFRKAELDRLQQMSEEQKTQFENQSKELKFTEEDLGDFYETQQLAIEVLNKQVTDESIHEEYNRQLEADESVFMTATVSHILIKVNDPYTGEEVRTAEEALSLAQEIKGKLDQGEDFAALAQQYSEDDGSKQSGGTYSNVPISNWVEGFKNAAATLPIGEISEPVETEFGYHVMKVSDRKVQSEDDVRDSLRAQVTNNLFSEYMTEEVPNRVKDINLPEQQKEQG